MNLRNNWAVSVADPGFPVGGGVDLVGGGVDSRGGYVLKILYVKTKELGPLGGGARRARLPLDPPMRFNSFQSTPMEPLCVFHWSQLNLLQRLQCLKELKTVWHFTNHSQKFSSFRQTKDKNSAKYDEHLAPILFIICCNNDFFWKFKWPSNRVRFCLIWQN